MSPKTAKYVRTVYGIILSLLVLIVGLLLILSCIDIYRSGDRPFSTESVGAHFSAIALPVYLCIIWAVGGAVLSLALPAEQTRRKGLISPEVTLARLTGKLDLSKCPYELEKNIRRQRTLRQIFVLVNVVLYVTGATRALIYALNKNNFPAADGQFNAEVLQGTLTVALYLAPPFLYSIVTSFLNREFRKREIALVKEAIALCATRPDLCRTSETPVENSCSGACPFQKAKSVFTKHQKTILTVVRCVVLAVGVLFVLLGIFNGGMSDVVQKAIKICTECIGLG